MFSADGDAGPLYQWRQSDAKNMFKGQTASCKRHWGMIARSAGSVQCWGQLQDGFPCITRPGGEISVDLASIQVNESSANLYLQDDDEDTAPEVGTDAPSCFNRMKVYFMALAIVGAAPLLRRLRRPLVMRELYVHVLGTF